MKTQKQIIKNSKKKTKKKQLTQEDISKKIEQEADNVCVYQYKRGAADFHKKRVIVQLLNSYSKKYEQIVIGMLHSWDLF